MSSPSTPRLPTKQTTLNSLVSAVSPPLPSPSSHTPRFDHLLGNAIGSPMTTNGAELMDFVDGASSTVPRAITVTRPPSPTLSLEYSIIDHEEGENYDAFFATPHLNKIHGPAASYVYAGSSNGSPPSTLRSLLPRLWDALSSPSARTISRNSYSPSRSGPSSPSGSPLRKGKGRNSSRLPIPCSFAHRPSSTFSYYDQNGDRLTFYNVDEIDYSALPPLDGEEGELIDDEACFISPRAVEGFDPLVVLPTETAILILALLDLPALLNARLVSRRWVALTKDNAVWHALYFARCGWRIRYNATSLAVLAEVARLVRPHSFIKRSPLALDWLELYQTRHELEERWIKSQPQMLRIEGHRDSVYCIEFDHDRIITGSRDRSIKIWSLRTGQLLGTLKAHRGSVLCLKFEFSTPDGCGLLFSGSSDCSVLVWDFFATGRLLQNGENEVVGGVRAVLAGHSGGVLDLKVDRDWIVSCSKDTLIRVWDRKTLALHRTFSGHEGPVNAVGLQRHQVASASGDGKMMLWDIETGARLVTFAGHDRGLACIEFKDDFIVSGSNDCKIKIWRASTGECIRTLDGHKKLVRALSFDPRTGRLVSASYDRTVKVWDVWTGKLVRDFVASHTSHIFDVKFDFARIVSTSHDQKIVILDFSQNLDVSLFA